MTQQDHFGTRRHSYWLWIGALFVSACGSSSNSAPNANSATDLGSITTSSSGIVVLLSEWVDAGENADQQVELFDRLVELARRSDWMDQLRAYELSEEEFLSLPFEERDQLTEIYLARSKVLKTLADAALVDVNASRAAGDQVWADQLRIAVGRVAQANDTEDVVLLGRIVAQGIARSVNPKG